MYKNQLYSTNLKVLLSNERCRNGVAVWKSLTQHARGSIGVLRSGRYGRKNVAGSYYGLLAYADLGGDLRSRQQCGKGHLEVTVESFQKWALELERKGSDSSNQDLSVWVV